MGRRWQGQQAPKKLALWVGLAAWLISHSAFGGAVNSFSILGSPNALGTRLIFGAIPDAQLDAKQLAQLRVTFSGGATIDLKKVTLAVNGLGSCHGTPVAAIAEWETNGNQRVLRIDIGKLYFRLVNSKTPISFSDYVRNIQRYSGRVTLWLRAPRPVASAELRFVPYPGVRPPVAKFTSVNPSSLIVQQSDITFAFVADRADARFDCQTDLGAFKSCNSPVTASFTSGYHQFSVRAIGPGGEVGPTVTRLFYTWVAAPAVQITQTTPPDSVTTSDSMAVSFTFTKEGYPLLLPWNTETSRYAECRIDGGAYKRCTSPIQYKSLIDGDHTIDIRRVSTHFFFWLSVSQPATYRWTIDRKIPSLAWKKTPDMVTSKTSADFEFESDVPAKYECRVDAASVNSCDTSFSLTSLAEGSHSLEVTAVTSNGARSLPLTYHWQVDTQAPVLTQTGVMPQQNPTNVNTLSLSFDVSEPADLVCKLDGKELSKCSSPLSLSSLKEGAHTIEVVGTDRAGNISEALSYAWSVDLTLPTLTIQVVDPMKFPTQKTSAKFHFVPSEQATFLCQLDSQPVFACGSDTQLTALSEGEHVLSVSPVDTAGNEGSPATFAWEIDLTAPQVKIASIAPSESPTASTSIRFEVDVNEQASLSCELDGGGAQPCGSPWILNNLADGEHRVAIKATDSAGNLSDAVAYKWVVSTIANVTLTGTDPEKSPVAQSTAQFQFASAESNKFQCALDGAAPKSCSSPQSYSGLTTGAHHFEVSALNIAGQPGPAASYDWVVDLKAPTLTVSSTTPNFSPTASTSLQVSFTTDEAATFDCRIDGVSVQNCKSPWLLSGLKDGSHQVTIRASDALGNTSAPWTYSWSVNTQPLVAKGTSVGDIMRTSATVGWQTNVPATSAVEYTENGKNPVLTTTQSAFVTERTITVTGLKAFTLYSVRGVSIDKDGRKSYSESISFRTTR